MAQEIVRVYTAYMRGHTKGFVVGESPKWLLIKSIAEDILADGYEVIEKDTIKKIETAKNQDFLKKALAIRKQRWKSAKAIDLRSAKSIIQSALEAFPLVTVYPGRIGKGMCYIGREATFVGNKMRWWQINPDARMDDGLTTGDLKTVTQISFGGLYEDALWKVNRKHFRNS